MKLSKITCDFLEICVFQEKCVLLCHASDAEYSDRVDASGNGGVRSLSCTAYDRTGTYG